MRLAWFSLSNTNKLFEPTKPTKSDIGREAGGKQDRIVKSEQLRNFFLQFILVIRCSAQQRYSARTYTALLDYFDSFLNRRRANRRIQIAVRSEHQHLVYLTGMSVQNFDLSITCRNHGRAGIYIQPHSFMFFEMRLKIFNLSHNVTVRARFARCVVDFEALHMNIDDGLNPYIDIRIMHNVVLYIQIYNIYFNTYPISLYFFCLAIQIRW